MKHKNENNPSTFNQICPTFRIGEIEKKNVLSSLSYLEGLTQYLSGRHFRLKGLQKEVQVPHLGMWSSAMENVKGEKENFK